MKQTKSNICKIALSTLCAGGALAATSQAALIAKYDFENGGLYVDTYNGDNPAVTDGGTEDRWFDDNTPSITGVESLSRMTWTVGRANANQNELDEHDLSSEIRSLVYRAQLSNATTSDVTISTSFDVTLTSGWELTNWNLDFGYDVNQNITYTVTVGGIDGTDTFEGNNNITDGGIWNFNANSNKTVATALTDTFTVKVDFTQTDGNLGTSRYDDFILTGDLTAVPEPSSAALLGLGGIALILRRRK
ncbi:MAG: PEP-CTERM sorting domain-containing protein [Rubritalea sp.]|uniref:PEP-CTERM sorting domain-containing protein n=1 Tax=Rubritalea sp. TaxID=2109375 RepID=UPI003242264C